jgi:hypothetical protein
MVYASLVRAPHVRREGALYRVERAHMRIALTIIGVVFVLLGAVWCLQGMNVLLGSPMSGQSEWTRNGAILAVVGLAIVAVGNRRRRKK